MSDGFIEAFLRDSNARAIDEKVDQAALVGSGPARSPLGVYNAAGTQTISFSAAGDVVNAANFQRELADVNVKNRQYGEQQDYCRRLFEKGPNLLVEQTPSSL